MASSKRWLATVGATPEKLGIALVRIVVGAVFVMHGWQKWFVFKPAGTVGFFHSIGLPPVAAYAAMTAELGCGALLVLGLFTRLAAVPILITMIVAILHVHFVHGFFANDMGYEYPLTLGVAAFALVLAGPGTMAADNVIG